MCGYKALTFYTMKTETLKVQARDSFCDVKYQLYSKHATATSPVQRTRWWHNAYNNYVLYHTELSWGAALKRYFSPWHEIQTFLDVKGQDARVVSGSEWLANSYFLHSFTCHESSQLKVDKSQDDQGWPFLSNVLASNIHMYSTMLSYSTLDVLHCIISASVQTTEYNRWPMWTIFEESCIMCRHFHWIYYN